MGKDRVHDTGGRIMSDVSILVLMDGWVKTELRIEN
jgi:hypothetical protein